MKNLLFLLVFISFTSNAQQIPNRSIQRDQEELPKKPARVFDIEAPSFNRGKIIKSLSSQIKSINDAKYFIDSTNKYSFTTLSDSSFIYKSYRMYDQNGNQTGFHSFKWDNNNIQWIDSLKDEYTFDSNDLITMEAHYERDPFTNNLFGKSKMSTVYDGFGNRTSIVYYIWEI
jgi:uncharacterized protein YkuJ